MLGHQVVEACPATWEVSTADIMEFDITSLEETQAFVKSVRPGVLINCAAMTEVDGCESEFEKAYRINGIGAGNLARAAFEIGAEMLHISTDYVFDGAKGSPYYEDDPVCPMSAYGRSKLAGETFVRDNNPRHWIVRTQWLYGPGGKNFVDTIAKAAKERDSLDVVDDQFGCPTFTKDLAAQVVRIVDIKPPYGIYHCSNEGSCSWFELAQRIVALAGLAHVEVRPMTSDRLDRPAKRPAHAALENFHLRMTIGNGMRPWGEALEDYLSARES
jgi:dTDP-4-dehydrorhamnose reductase